MPKRVMRPMALVAGGMTVGAAVLLVDVSDSPEEFPEGFYAIFGDEEWTADYATVLAMLAGESPDARAYPVKSLDGADELPPIPNEWPSLA
jgi:hypothetical protein